MSFKRQIAYNTTVQLAGKALCILISTVIVMLLTRYLGPSGYGQYNIAITFVGFFIVLADLGVYQIAVREMAQKAEEREKILGNVFVYRFFSALFVFLFAFLVGLLMPYENLVKLAIGIVAIQSFLGILTGSLISIYQVNYRMDLPALAEVLSRGLFLALVFGAIYFKFNLLGIFWFLVLVNFFNLLLVYLQSRPFLKLKPQVSLLYLKNFLKESLPMGLVVILSMIHFKSDTIILSLFKPSFDVGIYGASYRVYENLFLIPTIFIGLLFPKFSELFLKDKDHLKRILQRAIDLLILAVFPTVVFFFLFAPLIILVIAGKDFSLSIPPLRILLLTLFWIFLTIPLTNLLVAAKKQRELIKVFGIMAILNIMLNLFLIPRFSFIGAAWATFFSNFFVFLSVFILAKKLLKVVPDFSLLKKIFPLSVLSLLLICPFSFWSLLSLKNFQNLNLPFQLALTVFLLVLGFLIYFGLLFLFKIIKKEEISEIIKGS